MTKNADTMVSTVDEISNQLIFFRDGIKISGEIKATSGSFDPNDLANVINDQDQEIVNIN